MILTLIDLRKFVKNNSEKHLSNQLLELLDKQILKNNITSETYKPISKASVTRWIVINTNNLINSKLLIELKQHINCKIVKLESHTYAPELNKLHLNNGTIIDTPQCKNINSAINFVAKKILVDKGLFKLILKK